MTSAGFYTLPLGTVIIQETKFQMVPDGHGLHEDVENVGSRVK